MIDNAKVTVLEGQSLNMCEDIPPHISFDERTQPMAPITDDELQDGPDKISHD